MLAQSVLVSKLKQPGILEPSQVLKTCSAAQGTGLKGIHRPIRGRNGHWASGKDSFNYWSNA